MFGFQEIKLKKAVEKTAYAVNQGTVITPKR
jgi:hypothetical protein